MDILEKLERCPECEYANTIEVSYHPADTEETTPLYRCTACNYEWMAYMKKMTRQAMLSWLPMCAVAFIKKYLGLLDDPHYILEVKENGVRGLLVFTEDEGQLFTRTLAKEDGLPIEKSAWAPHLTSRRPAACVSCTLDGEITVGGINANHSDVGSRFNCSLEKSLARQRQFGKVMFTVWDVLMVDGVDLRDTPLRERLKIRDKIVASIKSADGKLTIPYVKLVETKAPHEKGQAFVDRLMAAGKEGAILKSLDGTYCRDGGRPAGVWLKIKEEDFADLFIGGYEEAEEISTKSDGTVSATKYKGMIGSMKLYAMDGAKKVFVCDCSGMKDEMRQELSDNREKYIGKVVLVKCQRVTIRNGKVSLQNPRFKGWKSEKHPSQCDYIALLQRAR